MLFAFPISAQFIRFFQLKEVIRAVVIEDVLSPFDYPLAVFIQLCLDKVVFFRKNGKCAVNVVKLERRLFNQLPCLFIGRELRGREQDPCLDQF